MRKFVQPVCITVPTYLNWCDLANQMILLGYRAFCEVKDREFPWIMYTDLRDQSASYFSVMSDIYNDWSDKRMHSVKGWNPDLYLALAGMSEGPEFYPGEWVCDPEDGHMIGVCIEAEGEKVKIRNLADALIVIQRSWIRKATKEEIIAHFATSEQDKRLDHIFDTMIAPHLDREEKIRVIKVGGWPPRVAFERLSDNTYHYFHVTKDQAKDFWSKKLYKEVVTILPAEGVLPYEEEDSLPESQRFTIDQAKEIIAKSLSLPVEQIEIDGR